MTAIHHLALRVRSCEVSLSFYSVVFGLVETKRFEEGGRLRAAWMRAGDVVVMLERSLRGRGPDDGSGHVLVFAAADLLAAEEKLRRLGIPLSDRTPSTLYFQDPDGHRCGLSVYELEGKPS